MVDTKKEKGERSGAGVPEKKSKGSLSEAILLSNTSILAGIGSSLFHRTRKFTDYSHGIDTKTNRSDFIESDNQHKKKEAHEKQQKKSCCGGVRFWFSDWWRKFSILCLSPIFLRHRNYFLSVLEIFVPAAFSFIVIWSFTGGISWKTAYLEHQGAHNARPDFPIGQPEHHIEKFISNYKVGHKVRIYVTPNTPFMYLLMSQLLEDLRLSDHNKVDENGASDEGIVLVNSAQELKTRCIIERKEEDTKVIIPPVGLEFTYIENSNDGQFAFPKTLSYTIHSQYEGISDTKNNHPYIAPPSSLEWENPYIASGFAGLQVAIDTMYQKMLLSKIVDQRNAEDHSSENRVLSLAPSTNSDLRVSSMDDLPQWEVKMFYQPNFYDGTGRNHISSLVTGTLVTAYLFLSYFIVRQIVQENNMGIKDMLKMHGMPVHVHWVILLLHTLLFRGITAGLVTWSLFLDYGHGALCTFSNYIIVFLLLWCHLCALTFFNFFLAVLIDSVSLAGLSAILIGFFSYVIPKIVFDIGVLTGVMSGILGAALPNWALANAVWYLIDYECDERAVTLETLFNKSHSSDYLTIGQCFLLLTVSGAFYFCLAVIGDVTSQKNLYPTYRWYHFIKKFKEWRMDNQHHRELLKDVENNKEDTFPKPVVYEEHSSDARCLVRVRHLCKSWGKHKLALQEISMNILHGEITVFLGHSGSGKSTIISILAGMVSPTTGYATIKGFDVSYDTKNSRKYTGLCPQKLIYFNLLTVTEHIKLCYRLRGYDSKNANRLTKTIIIRLKLWGVRNHMPSNLNQDELRRLGIAMALADAPKVLLLDEPTSNMDSMSRRDIWEIIKDLRQHHTIIMSTNFMDEAEYLADRIALIAHGKLICYGSPSYLKEQYDTGYFMRFLPNEGSENYRSLDTKTITEIVKNHLGEHVHQKDIVSITDMDNLTLELPRENKKINLTELCEELETRQDSLGFRKFSIRQVSLSDIFIKICESIIIEDDAPDLYVRRDSTGDWKIAMLDHLPTIPQDEIFVPKVLDQFLALTKKRILYLKTHNDYFILEYICPLILILVAVLQSRIFITPMYTSPPKIMSLDHFPEIRVLYRLAIAENEYATNYTTIISNILKSSGESIPRSARMMTKLGEVINAVGVYNTDILHSIALEMWTDNENARKQFMRGYFSSGSVHSVPLLLNLITNIRLKAISEEYTLSIVNDPLPTDVVALQMECETACVVFAVITSLSFAFASGAIIVFPFRERYLGVKHLQLMTGVKPIVYWITDYIFDFVIMSIMSLLITLVFLLDVTQTFSHFQLMGVIFLLTFLYLCWTSIPFAYFMSVITTTRVTGYYFMIVIHVITGILPFLLMELYFNTSTTSMTSFFRNLFLLFPAYTITSAMHIFFEAVEKENVCKSTQEDLLNACNDQHTNFSGPIGFVKLDESLVLCCERLCKQDKSCYVPPHIINLASESFSHPMLASHITALVLQGFLFWILLIIAERSVLPRLMQLIVLKFLKNMEKKIKPETLSKDIFNERMRVNALISEEIFEEDSVLLASELTKSYTSKMVINDFTLEVKKGQCVGILGGGGSGKSTIMQMLTGKTIPTRGMCYIGKYNLLQHQKQFLTHIGYCPQTNALFQNFTGYQMLELMGRLKGISHSHLPAHIKNWLTVFGLLEAAGDICKSYNPGMQRRLCTAMAFLGGNDIVLLDEPTSGVDPISRQRFWATIHQLRAAGRTIMFTSYNTEECTNLATKLVVISEGNVQCIGSPEELVERFSYGHTVIFRMKHEMLSHLEIVSATMGRVVEFKKLIEATFAYANLVDEQDNLLIYFLRNTRLTWSEIFRKCELIVENFSQIIESYDVTESLLEDLFILLTNKYREMDNPRRTEPLHPFDISKEEAEIADYEKVAKALREVK